MTYSDVLQNAKNTIKNCRVCPECNGLACGNLMPGPGSKAPGNGANVNWKAWQEIRLNMDTFVPHAPVDTSGKLFGREFSIPLIAGPIGSLLQYSDTDVTVPYNDGVMEAAAECGFLASFGDGLAGETLPGALASMEKHPAGVIPVLNPLPNETIIRNMAMFEQSSALALAVVVDSAGLFHWKGKTGGASSKTIEDLQELKAHTKKPFIIKGIMTALAAEHAVEAGADAIIVSNHGGRVLPGAPSTAEVLPEIVSAVKGSTVIIVDGGLRSGSDILKALALGADLTLICRPFPIAWFGGGAEGVKLYVEKLRSELTEAMYMCGARRLSDISREMLRF